MPFLKNTLDLINIDAFKIEQVLNFMEWEPNRFLLQNFKNPPLYEVSHRDQVKKRTEFPNIKILAL